MSEPDIKPMTIDDAADLLTGFSLALVRTLQMRGHRDHWFIAKELGQAMLFIRDEQPEDDPVGAALGDCAHALIRLAEENEPRCAVNLAEEVNKL